MPKAAPAESAPTQCRMDFSFRVLRAVEETRYVEVEIKPDPRRYTPVMRDHRRISSMSIHRLSGFGIANTMRSFLPQSSSQYKQAPAYTRIEDGTF